MCSSSEAGSYFRLIDFLRHSTLGLRVIQKKKKVRVYDLPTEGGAVDRKKGQKSRKDVLPNDFFCWEVRVYDSPVEVASSTLRAMT